MNVGELKELLSEFPDSAEVRVGFTNQGWVDATSVEADIDKDEESFSGRSIVRSIFIWGNDCGT